MFQGFIFQTIFLAIVLRRTCLSNQTGPPIQNHYIGDRVTLKCPTNDTTFFQFWSQGNISEINERVLADNNQINPEAPRSWRLKLEGLEGGHYNLIISNISEGDSGIYCCSTDCNGTPGQYCFQLIVHDPPKVNISKEDDTLVCSVSGIRSNSTFSWSHYTYDGDHISCHDKNHSILDLTGQKPYESEGIYTCTAMLDNTANIDILSSSVNVSGIKGHPSCFPFSNYSTWQSEETVNLHLYIHGYNDMDVSWTSNNSCLREEDVYLTKSVNMAKYPVNLCNTSIYINVQEYLFKLQHFTCSGQNVTIVFYINSTLGAAVCSHTVLVKKQHRYPILLVYIIGCFCCSLVLFLLSGFMKSIKEQLGKALNVIRRTKHTPARRHYLEEVVFQMERIEALT